MEYNQIKPHNNDEDPDNKDSGYEDIDPDDGPSMGGHE